MGGRSRVPETQLPQMPCSLSLCFALTLSFPLTGDQWPASGVTAVHHALPARGDHWPPNARPPPSVSSPNPPALATGDQPVPRLSENRPWLGRFWRKDGRTLGRNHACTVSFELLYFFKLNTHLESSLTMLKFLIKHKLGFLGLG